MIWDGGSLRAPYAQRQTAKRYETKTSLYHPMQQTNKKKIPSSNFETLLQSVSFLPPNQFLTSKVGSQAGFKLLLRIYHDNIPDVTHHMRLLLSKFYEIKPKNERPIKVVLKGLPRNFKVEEIQADLEELGFTPEKVNQLIGRRSKQPIPVFLVTLPRSIENLKIFHLKTLSYLSIRVEGYNGKGVTQCYTCNHFHHNSENCHLNPRCLKCGEGHITRECPITERLETAYCINCEMYGHMANWRGCPCFPKAP
ncbi:nucleic-acid-binding protein from transposon X-element [Trichonephila clavipes]|nr:nucleic-acid-binding protein from transposon X-element [Trichonephila clavipes]